MHSNLIAAHARYVFYSVYIVHASYIKHMTFLGSLFV